MRSMQPRRRMVLSALSLAACLSACASSKPRVVVSPPPAYRLTCTAEPRVPETVDDKATAQFILDALAAGADCRAKLGWVRDWAASLSD